jgi:hypothetical protein
MSWSILTGLGLGWWYKDSIMKFLIITFVVLLICYIIILAAKLEQKYWPIVFIPGALAIVLYYSLSKTKEKSWSDWATESWNSLPTISLGDEESSSTRTRDPDNPFYESKASDNPFYDGGKRRRKLSKRNK